MIRIYTQIFNYIFRFQKQRTKSRTCMEGFVFIILLGIKRLTDKRHCSALLEIKVLMDVSIN